MTDQQEPDTDPPSPEPDGVAELADALIGRAGWVCPTCVVRSISVAARPDARVIQVAHAPDCGTAAMFVTDPVPPLTGGTTR